MSSHEPMKARVKSHRVVPRSTAVLLLCYYFLLSGCFPWKENEVKAERIASADELKTLVLSSAGEEQLKEMLDQKKILLGQEFACRNVNGDVVAAMMEKGFFDTTENVIKACAEKEIKLEGIQQKANAIRTKISQITSLAQSASASQSIVAPAFEWAQSGDSVFLGVKFAHKLDAPACIDLINEKIEIKENLITLKATCKGKNKKFSLELELYENIDPDQSTWSMASVGRGTFTLLKKTSPSKWERLTSSKEKVRNMHTWWSLHEKYADELDSIKEKTETAKKEEEEKQAAAKKALEEADEAKRKKEAAESEMTEEEKKAEEQRKDLKKKAKVDTKRVKQEYKKLLKSFDAETKKERKSVQDRHKKELEEYDEGRGKEREKLIEERKEKTNRINTTLHEALHNINQGASTDQRSFYAKMSDMLFGSSSEEEERQEQDQEQDQDQEQGQGQDQDQDQEKQEL